MGELEAIRECLPHLKGNARVLAIRDRKQALRDLGTAQSKIIQLSK